MTASYESITEVAQDLGLERTEGDQATDPAQLLELSWLRPDQLLIDRAYQRRVSQQGLRRIMRGINDFDWCKFSVITVVKVADEAYAVIDGQHRALMAFATGQTVVPVIIFSADNAGQAAVFSGINVNRTNVASIDNFRARVASGDENAVTVHRILNELEVSTDVPPGNTLKPNETRAVVRLERLVKKLGEGLVFTTIEMLRDAQPDQPNLLTAFCIEATAHAVVKVVDGSGDLDRLTNILKDTDFESLQDTADKIVKLQGGKRIQRGGEQLLREYNKGLQNKI